MNCEKCNLWYSGGQYSGYIVFVNGNTRSVAKMCIGRSAPSAKVEEYPVYTPPEYSCSAFQERRY